MPSPTRLERPSGFPGFVPILLANLLPLVGVLELGWDPAMLVVIYAIEFLFSFLLAGAKALFAQRPPRADREDGTVLSVSSELTDKRGSVELVSWLPPFYPRNLPFATAVVVPAAWFVVVIGIVFSNVFAADAISRPEVAVSVAALIVGQSIGTWHDYLRDGYETASPYSVVETPARQAFFLTFVLIATPGITAAGAAVVLVVVVLVKLLVEWSAYRATRGDGGRLTGWLSGPQAVIEPLDPVCVPDDDPDVRVQTDSRAVLYTGAFHVFGRLAPFLAMPFAFAWILSLAFLGEEASPVVAVGATLVVFGLFVGVLTGEVLTFFLRYGPLEYRRYDDRLVAYDVLLSEPQWSTPVDVLRDVQVVPDRLPDRLLGTRTVAVTAGWGDGETRRELGPVTDPDTLVEAFELPVRTTALEPLDRRPAAVVAACLGGIVVTVAVLAVGPWISPGALLFSGLVYGLFGIPFVALVLRVLWEQAYPDRSD
ncbi:DUF6498-containing protein [Halobacteria archaeon AArc-m2/3/4]|uniref:DUF6498-containing protein n=1 Tax=Natronoglomus mannanivorans TaxID=2979990 RepID=A0ABT2QAX8_9EURY|nr:DUF6498-containing protein [Halobacteria archaeon AArc-m2/3/4]